MPAPPLGSDPAIVSATGLASAIFDPRQTLYHLKGIGFGGGFVRAKALHPGKTQSQTAHVARADLDFVERNFDHQLRLDVHGIAVAVDFKLQQFLRLPLEHFVGEALERLAQHCEAALFGVARSEMQVAEPSLATAVSPLGR